MLSEGTYIHRDHLTDTSLNLTAYNMLDKEGNPAVIWTMMSGSLYLETNLSGSERTSSKLVQVQFHGQCFILNVPTFVYSERENQNQAGKQKLVQLSSSSQSDIRIHVEYIYIFLHLYYEYYCSLCVYYNYGCNNSFQVISVCLC